MADNTPVNGQITDSVTQANTEVLGTAPAMSLATTYQSLGHSTGLMFESAVNAQQQLAIAAQAATNQGVIQIYTVNTMAGAAATAKIADANTSSETMATVSALKATKDL